MDDNWVVAIAMGTASLGIVLLLFALILLEPPQASIIDARAAPDGEPLQVKGIVRSVTHHGNMTVIAVAQEVTLDVVVFEEVSDAAIPAGSCVVARGKKSSYDGAAQLAGTRITPCEK